MAALTGCVARLTEQMSRLPLYSDKASRQKRYGGKNRPFKLPPQRHTTPKRNDQLVTVPIRLASDHCEILMTLFQRAVRATMNDMLGIKKDADVVNSNMVDYDAIAAFEDETGPGPTPPYAPDWSNIEGPWNFALFELFMDKYSASYLIRDEEEQEEVEKMFMDRLRRLKKQVKKTIPKNGETYPEMNARLLSKHKRELANQRRNSRRNEVRAGSKPVLFHLTDDHMLVQRGLQYEVASQFRMLCLRRATAVSFGLIWMM